MQVAKRGNSLAVRLPAAVVEALTLKEGDETKANRAEEELSAGGILGVHVLNEFATVASRKLNRRFENDQD